MSDPNVPVDTDENLEETIDLEFAAWFMIAGQDRDQGELTFRAGFLAGWDAAKEEARAPARRQPPPPDSAILELIEKGRPDDGRS